MHTDADLESLERHTEVILRDGPFEAPAARLETGPLYKNIEERMPELSERENGSPEEDKKLAVDRRDFMRLFGAGSLVASAAACVRRPVEYAIPYVNQPIDQLPGVATYYATTTAGPDAYGIIVKTREGRPVKIEGNIEHPLSQGGTNALVQSELQALFHPERRQHPTIRYGNNREGQVGWDEVYSHLAAKIKESKNVAIFTGGSTGSRDAFYRDFLTQIGSSKDNLFTYESQSLLATISKAHELAFGADGIPRTDLHLTELIVGVGAEFLDVGVAQVYETKAWSDGHSYRMGKMGRIVQFESRLTNTGAKAAKRYPIAPGDELAVTLALVRAVLATGNARGSAVEQETIKGIVNDQASLIDSTLTRLKISSEDITKLAESMLTQKSVVLAGTSGAMDPNGTAIQLAGIMANIVIGAYGSTIHFEKGWLRPVVKAGDLKRFMEAAPQIDMLFVIDCNPAFTVPKAVGFQDALRKIPTVVSIQPMPCETDTFASVVLNGNHYLENWGDEENVAGFWSLRQPVVRPTSNSQQAEDILLFTLASLEKPLKYKEYREYVKEKWQAVHKLVETNVDFERFFKAIQRRGFTGKLETRPMPGLKSGLGSSFKVVTPKSSQPGFKLVAHLHNLLWDGRGADRPVLQEAPDSITSVSWGTWVGISPIVARQMKLRFNDVVKIEGPGGTIEASIYPLPGLHPDTVAIPRGNGRDSNLLRVWEGVGVDPLHLLSAEWDELSGEVVTQGQAIKLTGTGQRVRLCAQQKQNDIANRTDIVKTVTVADAASQEQTQKNLDDVPDLYPKLPERDYRWGMSIDLSKCTGCTACTVACATENNVAQVGREQVLKGREMHWIKIDRYFAGPVENPEVTFQPMLCQHCNHAPCEAVCPVFATAHDLEGVNMMTYNRCVGTRYCANACPYKIRRFNWFTYKWNVIGERLVDRNPRALNPDVTVRTRGVMEKCSFCVQRVREAKHVAKERGGKVVDGEIKTACQQVCPANAIVFGNLNDVRSRAANERRDFRAYLALGGAPEHGHFGLKTLPNVNYLAKVTHTPSTAGGPATHHESAEAGAESNHHG